MELSRPDPATYPKDLMPPAYRLHGLRVGDIVKLHLRSGQAVWARVTTLKRADGTFGGEVEDSAADMRRGQQLSFKRCHVWGVV